MTTKLLTLQAYSLTLLLSFLQPTTAQVSDLGSFPVTKFPIPRCTTIVLEYAEYAITGDGRLQLLIPGTTKIEPGHFDISAVDISATVCYPLSDRLRNCHRQMALHRFKILPNRTITDALLDRRWPLGEFYFTDKGKAVVCNDDEEPQRPANIARPKGIRQRRACSYLTLTPNEYLVVPSDNSLFIVPANRSVSDASYTIDPLTLAANVCMPLSPALLNCSVWVLERNEVTVLSNKSLRSLAHHVDYELGDYVLLGHGRAAVCVLAEAIGQEYDANVERLHAAVNIISALFLAASIVIHLLLPELSYQRAPILCHAFSFMLTYLCLASRRLDSSQGPTECLVLFYITYYFIIASFAWLSVLAYDVWRITVHLSTGTTGYPWVNHFTNRKFACYALFGWGVPLLLCVMVAVVDRHESVQDGLQLFPRLDMMCWFSEQRSSLVFLYGPMCVTLVFNFVQFGLSVRNIQLANNQVEFTNKKLNKQLLVICFVVFLAMGLFWTMELVSFVTNTYGIHWIVPDLINGLQGVIIAVVYTCRPLTWRLLREKFSTTNIMPKQ